MDDDIKVKITKLNQQIDAMFAELEAAYTAMDRCSSLENQAAISHCDEALNLLVDQLLDIEEQENITAR
jgi:hypothetical protein